MFPFTQVGNQRVSYNVEFFCFQTSPVGIAFLKGHTGIVDFLLKHKGVDINFRNDAGRLQNVHVLTFVV